MRKFRNILSLVLILALAVGIMPVGALAAELTVDVSPEILALFVNETKTLRATVSGGVEPYDITWTYENPGGGQVWAGLDLTPSSGGYDCSVRGVSAGVTTVIVEVTDATGKKVTARCNTAVQEREMVTGITLDSSATTLSVGETFILTATAEPSSATDTSAVWNIANSDIASLSATSTANEKPITITALSPGVTTITARANDGSGANAVFTLTVTAPPEGIVLDSAASVVVGKTLKLSATVMPTTAYNRKVVWKSSNDTIAKVDYTTGVITGLKAGSCVITASVEGTDVRATCNLSVTVSAFPVVSISFNNNTATVIENKTVPLVVNINPTNASNKSIYLTSSDPTIATVQDKVNAGTSFNVTGKKPGTVTITAKSAESTDITATCIIAVAATPKTLVTGITLDKKAETVIVGGTVTPKATVTPTNASIKTVSWSSSNPNVVEVAANGKVTALAAGVATITATADDGSGKSASFTVNVASLDNTTLSLKSGETATLTVQNKLSTQNVQWVSSKPAVATLDSTTGDSITLTANGAGETTVTATIRLGTTTVATLKCVVTVTAGSNDIKYYISGKETVAFSVNDFNAVSTNSTGNPLSFVKFSLPDSGEGTLYTLYEKAGETKVSPSTLYYNSGTPRLADVSFVPAVTFVGPTTIEYTGTDSKGNSFTGKVIIAVTDASGDIKYSTAMNTPVTFKGEDFNSFCKEKGQGNNLSSIKFTLPKATEGTLYYMYGVDTNDKITGTKVTAANSYYYSNAPDIKDITFLPATGFMGTVDIKFSGRDTQTNAITGTVRITVGKGGSTSADIEYVIDKNEVLNLDLADFDNFSNALTGSSINYVSFTPPSALRGNLYHNFNSEANPGTAVTASARYYRSASPRIGDVSFVPFTDYEGTLTFKFTGMSSSGEEISGTVGVIVGEGYGDVRYSAGLNTPVKFGSEEFNNFSMSVTNANFDYIKFTTPNKKEGELIYQFGRSGEAKVTDSTAYNRTATPRLDDITFVPAKDFEGVCEFAFTGKSITGATISGTVAITYDPNLEGIPIIRYETRFDPVKLVGADFTEANSKRGAATLVSVEFVLPPANVGVLYEGYKRPNEYTALVTADKKYTASTISDITFVPKAGLTGSVAIPYNGTDSKGVKFTGYVQISVPLATTSEFKDMDKHSWAIPSVEYLHSRGIVEGIGDGKYGPGNNIRRGDFMLMLFRTFSLPSSEESGFSDVPEASYYATAITAAKAAGIALGDQDGRFGPNNNLTRQDAMVLIYRILEYAGYDLPLASTSNLNNYSDGRRVSDYAREAVSVLVDIGIIKGDDSSRLNPMSAINRAEVAVILHRVLTM